MADDNDGSMFLDVIRTDEALLMEAQEQLMELVDAVQRTGAGGRVTITVTVTQPRNASDRTAVYIKGKVDNKLPRPDTEDHLFFAIDGKLTRRDPRQPEMPLFRPVPADPVTGEVLNEETI